MYISKLHLQGFKSFLNKTDLNFGDGITAVVGPNGCGKTNIVDAIRWILGEQKTTVLRSTKMEDVIFNGTKNRKPISFCEATLTIHNDKGRLPVEYTDVEITRRLYRSGESEYLLNKVPCRLKDITELFVDTGMGADAYSVIELKMIETILSHNPSERRRLFEEAAGINKYKQQRQSTFRKLESTKKDLHRVEDIISEVETTVYNLQLQLKRFERYKKLTEKVKSSRILLAQVDLQILEEKLTPLKVHLSDSKSQQSALDGQVSLDESLIEQVEEKYSQLKADLQECQSALTSVEYRLNETNRNILVWTEQKKNSESRIQQNTDEAKQTGSRIETLKTQVNDLEILILDIQPAINQRKELFEEKVTKFDLSNQEYEHHLETHNASRKRYEEHLNLIHEHESGFMRDKATISEKEEHINRLTNRKDDLIDKQQTLAHDIQNLKTEVQNAEKSNAQQSMLLDKLQKEHAELEESIIDHNAKLYRLQSDKDSCKSKLNFYREIVHNHEGKSSGAKYVLSNPEKFSGVIGVVADKLEVDDKYRLAVEAGLGESADYLIVDSRESALEIIRKLRSETNTRVSIIPLDVLPRISSDLNKKEKYPSALSFTKFDKKLKPLFEFLLNDVLIVESLKDLEKLKNSEKMTKNWVTPNGEYYSYQHIIKSGKRGSKDSFIGRQKQIEKLETHLVSLQSDFETVQKKLDSLKTSANESHKKVQLESDKLEQGIQKLHLIEKEYSQNDFIISQNKETLKDIEAQLSDTNAAVTSLKKNQNSQQLAINELKTQSDKIKKSIEEDTKALDDFRIKRNELQQAVQDARVSLVEIEKEFEGYKFRKQSASDQLNDLHQRLSRFETENSELNQKITELNTSLDSGEINKQELLQNQSVLEQKKRVVEEAYNKSYEELQNLQRAIRNRQKAKEESILKLKDVELQISEIESEKEHIRSRIYEVFQVDVPAKILNLDEIQRDELQSSIGSIDRSIERIGPINMAVSDEYEKESQRFEFLKEQHNDLIESETTLRETIKKIDEEARIKFNKTFEEVALNFKKTYTMFFDGGEAHIRMVGDSDPLDADIEIIARPPGKRTQTMRMLSAGEKALTSIALLFAIYLVKPSPFCILDEVDAPLDDSNIRKFTNALQEFAKNTQFIIVTHNKLTMEVSDYLYGVTQEEEGVSKVVSVKFKEEEKAISN
ncbi:MAG: chromosome segregation protein SMC [Candidatus Marinimicrobia bacterium]|nr:chromosome segregation protein SMC [Candidatus Neomarinimicrobiota bacterium]MBL7023612.1 chromosome segregation protein SMC [Candidatus Neomarinimicrobiota bacterium]MBL7109890.1 chromosome segregation protein SMC [Candidatus Neomarinimicrobiota bacterium]